MKSNMFNIPSDELPTKWYNIMPDLPEELPKPKNPEGKNAIENLPKMMVKECLSQEFSTQNWIDIPEEILQLYFQAGRPRPLFRAKRLEQKLKTKCRHA